MRFTIAQVYKINTIQITKKDLRRSLSRIRLVQREGFEPPKANAKRFTVSRV